MLSHANNANQTAKSALILNITAYQLPTTIFWYHIY